MNLPEVLERCALACEAEAVARGYPASCGRELFVGCVEDDLQGWDEAQFLKWIDEIEAKYIPKVLGESPISRRDKVNKLMAFYEKVSKIMGAYASLITKK